jgi:hypothetical protein
MTTVDFEPLSVAVPFWEDPPGVFRVGDSRGSAGSPWGLPPRAPTDPCLPN